MRLRLAGLVIALFLYPSLIEYFGLTAIPGLLALIVIMLSKLALVGVGMLTILAGPAILLCLFSKTRRKYVLKHLGIWVLVMPTLFVSIWLSSRVRHFCFEQVAIRAKPLIAAIEIYEQKNGHTPSTLKDLVPNYLDKIPSTGLAAYPRFKYNQREEEMPMLYVPCSISLLNWDIFFYRPSKVYESNEYGGVIERIGDWAYVHE